eukprot:269404-Hanusia_phi.AAC.3
MASQKPCMDSLVEKTWERRRAYCFLASISFGLSATTCRSTACDLDAFASFSSLRGQVTP